MLRSLWPRLCVIALPLLIGGILWSQVSTKPPLATPPPDQTANRVSDQPTKQPTATATRQPTVTPSPTHTPLPTPTPTDTPEPMVTVPPQVVTPSPTPSVEGHSSLEPLPSLPAVVRLSADERGRYILIDQATQIMHIFEEWREIQTFPVSTGLPDPQTQTPEWSGTVGKYVGTFEAFGTYQDDGWYLFSRGGSILLHSAPYTLDEAGHKVYLDLDVLGQRPASHGCIRLAPEDAAWLTAWNPRGVPTTITAWPFGQPGRESDYDEEDVG